MKSDSFSDNDLTNFINQRYPKLTRPLERSFASSPVTIAIREEDIFEISSIVFDFDKLYFRENQLTDLDLIEGIASSCVPFLQFQADLLRENIIIMSDNERMYKELRVLTADLAVTFDKVRGTSIKKIDDLDRLINEHINNYNINFAQTLSQYMQFKHKRIKFFQRLEFDFRKIYAQTFDLELFYKNSVENINEMIKRINETVNTVRTLLRTNSYEVNVNYYLREVREELIQHFSDIRGIMKDVMLIFEYIFMQRRDLLKEVYIRFDPLYTFSQDINNNISAIFKLNILGQKRLVTLEDSIEGMKTRLLKINLPISLVSSQQELDNIDGQVYTVIQYLNNTKKEIKTLETSSEALYCKYLKLQIGNDLRQEVARLQTKVKDLTEIIKHFREIAVCENAFSTVQEAMQDFFSKNSRYLQSVSIVGDERRDIFDEANLIMLKFSNLISELKKLDKIKVFRPYTPISEELKLSIREKYDEVYRFQQSALSKISKNTGGTNIDVGDVYEILLSAENAVNKNLSILVPQNFVPLTSSLSVNQIERELERILSVIRESQSYLMRLEKIMAENPQKVEANKMRFSQTIFRLRVDVDNARLIHMIFDDVNFFNLDSIKNSMHRNVTYGDKKPIEDILTNLGHHIDDSRNYIETNIQKFSKDLVEIAKKRLIFEENVHKVLTQLNTKIKNVNSLETFFERHDQKIILMDRKYYEDLSAIIKQTDSLNRTKQEILSQKLFDQTATIAIQDIIDSHIKDVMSIKTYDISFYDDLLDKLLKCLNLEPTHQKLAQTIWTLLGMKPTQPRDRFLLVENMKQALLDYLKFYEDMDDVRKFFKNHVMYQSYKKLENMHLLNNTMKDLSIYYEFYTDLLKALKDTEQMVEDPDEESAIYTIPLANLRAKYFNKAGYGAQLNNYINLLDGFFSTGFFS